VVLSCAHNINQGKYTDQTLDLDLDSIRIQVDALGHTSTPFRSVLSYHLCFLQSQVIPILGKSLIRTYQNPTSDRRPERIKKLSTLHQIADLSL